MDQLPPFRRSYKVKLVAVATLPQLTVYVPVLLLPGIVNTGAGGSSTVVVDTVPYPTASATVARLRLAAVSAGLATRPPHSGGGERARTA